MSARPKIKLFIDAHTFDKEFQGTRTFIKELYRSLSTLTDQVEFYLGASDVDNLKKEFGFLPEATFIQYKHRGTALRTFFEVPKIIKRYNIDVAHFQYISPFRRHCDYLVTTHDILFNDFKSEFSFVYRLLRNFLFKYSIKRATFKTTVSSYSRARIVHHYHLNQNEIVVIPNGVNKVFYEAYDKPKAVEYVQNHFGVKKYLLYVSRIEPRKNNILLLQAYLQMKLYEKGIALVFIGKTSIHSAVLEQTIAMMPAKAKKLFFRIEQVKDLDLLEFYKAAEVFVYPSKAEGFGIPPLEAAALKIPVLCSNKTAMADFTFFNGNYFDPENIQELIEKLNRVLFGKDVMDYSEVSRAVEQNYSWEVSAQTLINLLKTRYPAVFLRSLN